MPKKILTDSKENNLEQKIIQEIKQGDFSAERALLIASGLTSENQINEYRKKIETTVIDFKKFLKKRNITNNGNQNYQTAKVLFKYLQKDHPDRYNHNPLLTKVIDSQLSKDKKVGNCNGLTSLYTVLGLRLGLNLSVLFNDIHILTLLEEKVLIDHTDPHGFDVSFKNYPGFKKGNLVFLIASTYNHRGIAKKGSGDFEGALVDCDKAIELNPKSASAYHNRSLNKASLGDLEESLVDCDKSIELNPKPAYYTVRGIVKKDLGDFEGAIADQDKAIELDPEYAPAYYNRGIVKKDLGDLEGSLVDCDKAIELNPKYELPYNNRGIVKLYLKDLEGAIIDYNKAIEINPKDADPYNNRGIAKLYLKDFEGAIIDYSKAIELNPKDANAYYNRSKARLLKHNFVGMIKDFFQYLKLK